MATVPDEARLDGQHPDGQHPDDQRLGDQHVRDQQLEGEPRPEEQHPDPQPRPRVRLPSLRRRNAPTSELVATEPATSAATEPDAGAGEPAEDETPARPLLPPLVARTENGASVPIGAPGSELAPDPEPQPAPETAAPAGPAPGLRSIARRERRRRRANRRRWLVTVPVVLVVLVVVAIVGAQLRGDAPARTRTASRAAVAPVTSNVPTLLLAHVAGDGHVDLAALVGVTRDGKDGSILLVPTLTQTETPSLDFQLLSDLRSLGSTSLLQTTIENLLGVRIDATVVYDDARLTAAIASAGPLTVDLNGDATVGSADQPRVFPSGTQSITPGDAAALLTQRPSTDEIDHMVTVQAVFEGWLAALRTASGAATTAAREPALRPLIAAAHTSTDFSVLPVDAISSGPGERYQPRQDAVAPAMQQEFPDQVLGIRGRRLRTEILNGTGVVGLVQQVAGVVVPAGAEVVTTGNMPGFGQTTTRVVYYRDADRAAAGRILQVLGAGKLVKEPNDIKVFDVTIIVGADFTPPKTG